MIKRKKRRRNLKKKKKEEKKKNTEIKIESLMSIDGYHDKDKH